MTNLRAIIKECIQEILNESYLSLDEITHPELAATRMNFSKGKQARELIDPPKKVKTKKSIRYKIGTGMITIPANHDILLFHSKNPQLNSYVFANERVWCPVSKENQAEFLQEREENVRLPIIKKRFS